MQAFADAVNSGESYDGKTVTLTANIDLGGESNPWTAIGTAANPFKGTFDGGYHVISGLYIASGSAVGLFGEVNGGTVQNLVVRGEVNGTSNAAGVIGKLTAVQTEAGGQIEYGIVEPQCDLDSLVQVFIIKDFEVVE